MRERMLKKVMRYWVMKVNPLTYPLTDTHLGSHQETKKDTQKIIIELALDDRRNFEESSPLWGAAK